MTPTAVEAFSDDSSRVDSITVSLTHQDQAHDPDRRRLHKLGADVPFNDVKPPPGVLTHALDTVHLALSISRTHRRKRQKVDTIAAYDDVPTEHRMHNCISAAELDACDDELPEEEAGDVTSNADFDDLLLATFDSDHDHDTAITCPVDQHGANTEEARLSTKVRKRASIAGELECEGQADMQPDAVFHLVDAAVRLAISSTPRRLNRDVYVTNSMTFRHLSDLAPSLWSPGYLPAMSDRAVFLPTVSHALSSIGAKSCDGRLRSKLAKLSRTGAHANSNNAKENIAVRLWQLLQLGLYDEKAARRLKPLAIGKTPLSCEDDEDCLDLVDSSQQSSRRPETAAEDGFDDLDDCDEFDDFEDLYISDLCEEDFIEPLLCGGYGGALCDTEDTVGDHRDGLARLEQLLNNEPSHSPSFLGHAASPLQSERHNSISACRDLDDTEDDLLSIRGSIGSIPVTEEYIGPDAGRSTERWYARKFFELSANGELPDMERGRQSWSATHSDDTFGMLAI